jgi:hypothetical protein
MIRLDGKDGREVLLPRSYLDGRGQRARNRRVDLAYATTGHRAQGLTRGRALVRLTGSEDVNWLYVQLSRARQDTRLYAVVGPEPQGVGELDLPDREQPDGYVQLAQALSRAGGQTLAIDTPPPWISDGYPRPSSGPSGTGCAVSSTRPPATAAASSPAPPRTASRPRQPWPLTNCPTDASPQACFAGCAAAATSPPRSQVGWPWLPNRPTAPRTASGSCAMPDPGVVVLPVVAVHGAQVPWGKVVMDGVPVVPARRLPSMLRALPMVLGPERVAVLADRARVRFRAAA